MEFVHRLRCCHLCVELSRAEFVVSSNLYEICRIGDQVVYIAGSRICCKAFVRVFFAIRVGTMEVRGVHPILADVSQDWVSSILGLTPRY